MQRRLRSDRPLHAMLLRAIGALACVAPVVSLPPAIIAGAPVTPTAVDDVVRARSFRLDAG